MDGLKVSPASTYHTYDATVHHHPFHYLSFETESWIGGPVATLLLYIESYSTSYSISTFYDCFPPICSERAQPLFVYRLPSPR